MSTITFALPTVHLPTLERLAIAEALDATRGNRVRAARLLGIHVRTLHRKLRALEAAEKIIDQNFDDAAAQSYEGFLRAFLARGVSEQRWGVPLRDVPLQYLRLKLLHHYGL